jgi:hypothetical protein
MDKIILEFRGVELTIEGNYDPGEEEVRYYSDMSGTPSTPSSFEIQSITVRDSDVDLFDLLEDHLEVLEIMCLEKIEE